MNRGNETLKTEGRCRNTESGLSMIELMIGILLGALIIIVVLYILAGSRASSQTIEAESRMQDNIQFAVEVLNSTIRQAGYANDPTADYTGIRNGDIIEGEEGTSGDTDSITIYYQGGRNDISGNSDNSIANCLGNNIDLTDGSGNPIISSSRFFVEDNILKCETTQIKMVDETQTGSTLIQPLIGSPDSPGTTGDSQVTDFQILYGLDTTDDGSVNQYKKIDQIAGANERSTIISVSIEITLEERIGADTLQKTFTSAVYLRNRV